MENPKFDANVYYLLKAQNKEVAKKYLKHCKDAEEREERRAEREINRKAEYIEKIAKIIEENNKQTEREQRAEAFLPWFMGIIILIGIIITASI